ncbi:MAG: hypothetical protein AB1352_01800 [Patescibacteria group bacterium]
MPNTPERYSFEKAQEEASQMQEKIKSGEAATYDEAEKLIEEQREKPDFFAGLDDRQRDDLLRFFLEKHDQEKFAKEVPEREPIQYPGKNPFEVMKSKEALPEKGMIFSLQFKGGYEGVGHVVAYEKLERPSITEHGDRIYLSVQGRDLYFSIENPNYFYKSTEPYNRMSGSSYVPHGFDRLDAIPTSDGGRALVQKKAWGTNLSYSIDSYEDRDFSRVLDEGKLDELQSTIVGALQEKIGLSQADAERVASEVVGRMAQKEEKE